MNIWNSRAAALAAVALMGCSKAEAPKGEVPAAATVMAAPTLYAFVSNEDSRDMTIIDATTYQVVGTVPVGTRPRGIKVSPDGKTVYVALSGSPRCPPTMPDEECEKLVADKSKDGIAVVDVASRKTVKVIPGGSDPEAFALSSDGSRLFVSNEDAGTASIVNLTSGVVE
ncbi:MAG TPA: hypothetical protein VMJ30_06320, partial [Gemmatimonadales bacterium]|nr:hypothetical protein [Gemmatimonadales bacterium]